MRTEERNVYTSLWNKYRPAILKLMSASAEGPQQYKLFPHEFKALDERQKGFTFLFQAYAGKAQKSIQNSRVAFDLLQVLQQSKTAQQLMSEATFEFSMDKHFVFHVNRKEAPEPSIN